MKRDTLHMTLAFVGDVSTDRLTVLEEVGGSVVQPAFAMTVDCIGYWQRKKIVWAGCTAGTGVASALVEDLRDALGKRGFPTEMRPFKPHVTLLRKVRRPPETDWAGTLTWAAREFVLVASQRDHTGSSYRHLASWPLTGADRRA